MKEKTEVVDFFKFSEMHSTLTPMSIIMKNLKKSAWRKIDGQVFIIDLEENVLNALNPVASRIWQLLNGKNNIWEVTKKIHQEFEMHSETIYKDTLVFIKRMMNKKLLILKIRET